MNIVTNFTETPGSCCPTYTCDECSKEDFIDGKCICATDATLSEQGICECTDPHKSIKNNQCVCDKNLCELPYLCDEYSVPVKYTEGCCENFNCIRCPQDSVPYPIHNFSNIEIESKCICSPCPEVICDENATPVLITNGKNFPGNCCNQYECQRIIICNVSGTLYQDGDEWMNGEENCTCRGGISFCTEPKIIKTCEADDGTIYKHKEKWNVDNCTSCDCVDGKKKCISHMCSTKESFSSRPDCPSMDLCPKNCEYGYKIKQGCEVCKCKLPDKPKYKQLETIMNEYNYSEEFVLELLNKYKENTSRFTTTTMQTTTNTVLITTNHSNVVTIPNHDECSHLRGKNR